MERVLVEFAGDPLPRETRNILEETLTRALQALKGDLRSVDINRQGRTSEVFRCDTEAQKKVWNDQWNQDLSRLRSNPYLKLVVSHSGATELLGPSRDLSESISQRITIEERAGADCRIQRTYAR